MELTNSQLVYYVDNRLKLQTGKRADYLAQVDSLIARFKGQVDKNPDLFITKFLKTGSLRKGTVLRPRAGRGVDADIAVFIDLDNTTEDVLDRLHHRIRTLLQRAYPGKDPTDFEIQPRTLGITFEESGLEVDLVPILPIAGPGDYGLQPSSKNEPFVKTSVTGQLEFIRKRKDAYSYFTALVRLIKHWRNYKELDALRSFSIELIVSYLQDTQGNPVSIYDGLLRFFLWVAQSDLASPVTFRQIDIARRSYSGDRVIIVDPVNDDNNVAHRMTASEAVEIAGSATEAWELLSAARNTPRSGETMDYCKSVFGPSLVLEG